MPKTMNFEVVSRERGAVNLAMQSLWVTGRLSSVGARLWVRHDFTSAETRPLEVVYAFALPREAALRSFRVKTDAGYVESKLMARGDATANYEEGILQGALSALASGYSDGLINLTCGNIRPGEKVEVILEILVGVERYDHGFRFRFPFTLAPSYHAQAKASVTPEGMLEVELPAAEFGDVILPRYALGGQGVHSVGFELAIDADEVTAVASPSHSIRAQTFGSGQARVGLATAGALPDSDLVLDVETVRRPVLVSGPAADGTRHFSAVIPSSEFGEPVAAQRSVVIVLDRSGSMEGEPLVQAKRALTACLALLEPEDRIGLVTFSTGATAWNPKLVSASRKERDELSAYLETITADGGTELDRALELGTRILGGAGEIFLITDGEVFGTNKIILTSRLRGTRIHILGIGAASQDRFLHELARETGGVSRFLTSAERVDLGAAELFASVARPMVEVRSIEAREGRVLTEIPKAVYSGTPISVLGTGADELKVVSSTGEHVWQVARIEDGETLRLFEGARRIAALEATMPENGKESERVRKALRLLSEEYGLASREISLVAVMPREGDVAGVLPKTVVVPTLAHQAFFAMPILAKLDVSAPEVDFEALASRPGFGAGSAPIGIQSVKQTVRRLFGRSTATPASPPESANLAFRLAAMIEPDGGIPGKTLGERIARSLVAMAYLAQSGSSLKRGPFRAHIARLARFLELQTLNPDEAQLLAGVRAGKTPKASFDELAASVAAGDPLVREQVFSVA